MASGGGASMNRMLIMLPVMFAAQRLDGENPDTIFYLRLAYGIVQGIGVVLVLSVYVQASKLASDPRFKEKIIYVQPPAQPFADPNARPKYTQVVYGSHVVAQARMLIMTTVMGLAITLGLHLYRGMIVGLAIQTIMGPLTFYDNALIKCMVFGKGVASAPTEKIFSELTKEELPDDVDIVDEMGSPVAPADSDATSSTTKSISADTTGKTDDTQKESPFASVLLDTWDAGASADIGPLMDMLNRKNVNTAIEENGWTPLMVVSALGTKSTPSTMRHLKSLGADVTAVDLEGWNALHWAAFHGSVEGARVLLSSFDAIALGLHAVKDKEGLTPFQHAKQEGNSEIADLIEAAATEAKKNS